MEVRAGSWYVNRQDTRAGTDAWVWLEVPRAPRARGTDGAGLRWGGGLESASAQTFSGRRSPCDSREVGEGAVWVSR